MGGSSPESPIPGKWSSTTEELSGEQLKPDEAQGVGLERFHRRTRPPTAERSTIKAARSEAISGAAEWKRNVAAVNKRRWSMLN